MIAVGYALRLVLNEAKGGGRETVRFNVCGDIEDRDLGARMGRRRCY